MLLNAPCLPDHGREILVEQARKSDPFVAEEEPLEVETVHVGRRMALLKGRMWRESDGVVVSTCEHDKFTTDARAAKI